MNWTLWWQISIWIVMVFMGIDTIVETWRKPHKEKEKDDGWK